MRFYLRLCKKKALQEAWRVVHRNSLQSQSEETRLEAEEFSKNSQHELAAICVELKNKSFKFPAARGIPIQKKGKSKKRPIVRAPIRTRVVQRAMLDIIQPIPSIRKMLHAGYNFGGIRGGGVPHAIARAYSTAKTHRYFIRTDIQSFFDSVPRDKAIAPIMDAISADPDFSALFATAVTTELDNLAALTEEERKLFPLEDTGVAQGSALSPLICNIFLHDFDSMLNARGIVCIRYIDDFIIFGPDRKRTRRALQSARRALQALGLDAYDPETEKKKAQEGEVMNGFTFLGCDIHPNQITPNADSRKRLIEKVQSIFRKALHYAKAPRAALTNEATLGQALTRASNSVRGWGNTYFFCNDDRIFNDLDKQIDVLVNNFLADHERAIKTMPAASRRGSVGIRYLADRKRDTSLLTPSVKPRGLVNRCVKRFRRLSLSARSSCAQQFHP